MRKKKLLIFLFKIIPKSLFSRIFGYFARIPLPAPVLNALISWYVKKFNINMDEYSVPSGGFRNFDMFFTRELKPNSRKISAAKNALLSPVDARVDQSGKIRKGQIIQAKGILYGVDSLIPSDAAKRFQNGYFVTLYLSPADYHRIHSPVSGKITGFFHIPGKLYTVQEFMVQGLEGLFSINERLISYIETAKGLAAVCKVGAMNVGRISLSYASVVTNKSIRSQKEVFFDESVKVKAGDEIGAFHLGSTIILLFEKGMAELEIKPGERVRFGQSIGRLL
ncbi:MAG: archaetidylserine decarboxylase [Leptospirales bacterium]|nr:archaetidylserine decarboxylase [Leptospirales bacterium]